MCPYATKNQNHPNITEIVFENDLDEIIDKNSQDQLKDSLDAWAAIEAFNHVFTVFFKEIFRVLFRIFPGVFCMPKSYVSLGIAKNFNVWKSYKFL